MSVAQAIDWQMPELPIRAGSAHGGPGSPDGSRLFLAAVIRPPSWLLPKLSEIAGKWGFCFEFSDWNALKRSKTVKFHLALRTVARLARRRGAITSEQFDAISMAVPVMADSQDSVAADLAQTAFEIGVNDGTFDGATPAGKINWANFFAFLEKILPLILQLITVKPTA